MRTVVRLTQARFVRRGGGSAQISGSYRWFTNAPELVHTVTVTRNGQRVSRRSSRIEHSPGRRMAGEVFQFATSLSDNKPPFGRVRSGVWRVRVSISGAGRTDAASQRYVVG